MKLTKCAIKMACVAVTISLTACHTHKPITPESTTPVDSTQTELLKKVDNHVQKNMNFIGSKLKFSVSVGDQELALTGNLRMKRNDVIRLQLMAFGFVEAARLEFTNDYVLIVDRINKQYLKAPYYYIDFMRNSGINFHTLQSLFCNELFLPGQDEITEDDMNNKFTHESLGDNEAIISYDNKNTDGMKGQMNYSWLVNEESGRIKMANISYRQEHQGSTQLNWDYREFKQLGSKLFPSDMVVTLTLPKKEVKLGIRLNYLNNNEDWEPRTRISDKYKEVDFDDILRRFMAL